MASILLPTPRIEVYQLYGIKSFKESILNNREKLVFFLFIEKSIPAHVIARESKIKIKQVNTTITGILNKAYFFGTPDLIKFIENRAAFTKRRKWKICKIRMSPEQKNLLKNNLRGKRVFIPLEEAYQSVKSR